MSKINIDKLFSQLHFTEPPANLFDKIIFVIEKKELHYRRRLIFGFLFLSIISLAAVPFSWTMFANQVRNSGVIYFVSAAVSNLSVFFTFGQDFSLAIVESIPVMGVAILIVNILLIIFDLRIFLSKKNILLVKTAS